jgi:hypothetical protein
VLLTPVEVLQCKSAFFDRMSEWNLNLQKRRWCLEVHFQGRSRNHCRKEFFLSFGAVLNSICVDFHILSMEVENQTKDHGILYNTHFMMLSLRTASIINSDSGVMVSIDAFQALDSGSIPDSRNIFLLFLPLTALMNFSCSRL